MTMQLANVFSHIRRLHQKEIRQWKAALLRKYLAHPERWKELQNIYSYTSKPLHQHPPLDEFAMMFERLFIGTPEAPMQPNHAKLVKSI